MTSTKEIDSDSKMYQFDTTAEIGKNIYLNGSGKYKKYIGYKCNFAIKYYDEEYNFLVQKCKTHLKITKIYLTTSRCSSKNYILILNVL